MKQMIWNVMEFRIGFLKVDFIPQEYNSDLCLGTLTNQLNLDQRNRCIYFKDFTIKYTRALVFQAFVRNNFYHSLTILHGLVDILRDHFNKYKATKVSGFKRVHLNNFHGTGFFLCSDFKWLSSDNLSDYYLRYSSNLQENNDLSIPFRGQIPANSQIVVISKQDFTLRLILRTKYFSAISKDFQSMQISLSILEDLSRRNWTLFII